VRATAIWLSTILLIIVTAILVIPRRQSGNGRVPSATTQIAEFGIAFGYFQIDNGHFPTGTNGIIDLRERPPNATNWHGPYIDRIPKDPWGHDYIYECPGRHNPQSYDLSSMGPDGRIGGGDDICNWKKN
jgi:general secretion pathway protein G